MQAVVAQVVLLAEVQQYVQQAQVPEEMMTALSKVSATCRTGSGSRGLLGTAHHALHLDVDADIAEGSSHINMVWCSSCCQQRASQHSQAPAAHVIRAIVPYSACQLVYAEEAVALQAPQVWMKLNDRETRQLLVEFPASTGLHVLDDVTARARC